jgi:GxxExxY protein
MLKGEGITAKILAAAIEVHKTLGPGLLESAYEECLCFELTALGIRFDRQKELPIIYKGTRVDGFYRIDLIVDGSVIVELKSVEVLAKIHEAQILTYMRLSGIGIGLLLNFNVPTIKDGIKRFVL